MKIKRFLAADMRQAMREVRAEQGADAVILSTRRLDDGIEIIAAIDYDETLVREAARHGAPMPEPAVLLVQPQLRPWLARFTRHVAQNLHVLAYNEVPDNRRVRLVQALGR